MPPPPSQPSEGCAGGGSRRFGYCAAQGKGEARRPCSCPHPALEDCDESHASFTAVIKGPTISGRCAGRLHSNRKRIPFPVPLLPPSAVVHPRDKQSWWPTSLGGVKRGWKETEGLKRVNGEVAMPRGVGRDAEPARRRRPRRQAHRLTAGQLRFRDAIELMPSEAPGEQ